MGETLFDSLNHQCQIHYRHHHYLSFAITLTLPRQRAELVLGHVHVRTRNGPLYEDTRILTAGYQPRQVIREPDKVHVAWSPGSTSSEAEIDGDHTE